MLPATRPGGRFDVSVRLASVVAGSVPGFWLALLAIWLFAARLHWVPARLVDGLLTLPGLVVALAIVGVLGKSFPHLLLALVVTEWPWCARVYRTLFLSQARTTYALAAHSIGAHPVRIVARHLAPNLVGPLLVLTTSNFGAAMLALSSLSFVGLGVEPPQAEWGAMVRSSRGYVTDATLGGCLARAGDSRDGHGDGRVRRRAARPDRTAHSLTCMGARLHSSA